MTDASQSPAASANSPAQLVFISHSSLDREAIELEIVPFLQQHGFRTWYSAADIRPGDEWQQKVIEGLERCNWFLLVMSPRASESQWVKDELNLAIERCPDRVIPLLLEPCDLKQFHIRVPRLQYVDFAHRGTAACDQLLDVLVGRVKMETPGGSRDGGHGHGGHGRRRNPSPPWWKYAAVVAAVLVVAVLTWVLWPVGEREHVLGIDAGLIKVARPVSKLLKEHGHTSVGTMFIMPDRTMSLSGFDLRTELLGMPFISERMRVAFHRNGIAAGGLAKVNLGGKYDIAWNPSRRLWRMRLAGELTEIGQRTPLSDWNGEGDAPNQGGVRVEGGKLETDIWLCERDIVDIFGTTIDIAPSAALSERVGLLKKSMELASYRSDDGVTLSAGPGSKTSLQVLVDSQPQSFELDVNTAFYRGPTGTTFVLRIRNDAPHAAAVWITAFGYRLFDLDPKHDDAGEKRFTFHVIQPREYLDVPGFFNADPKQDFRVREWSKESKLLMPLYLFPTFTCSVAAAWAEGEHPPDNEPPSDELVLRTSPVAQPAANDPELKYRTGVLRSAISIRVDDGAGPNSPFGKPENPDPGGVFLPPMPPPNDSSGQRVPAADVEPHPETERNDKGHVGNICKRMFLAKYAAIYTKSWVIVAVGA